MSLRSRTITAAAALAVAVGTPFVLAPPSSGATASPSGSSAVAASTVKLHKLGTATMTKDDGNDEPPGGEELRFDPDEAGTSTGAVRNRSPRSRAKSTRGTTPLTGIKPTQTLTPTGATAGFEGINHFDQRYTDGGNQYSLVPPDQALCAGNGQVFEGVNNAFRTYSTTGAPLSETISANQFFWKDHEIDRSTGVASHHQLGDPSCVYDAGSNRFYLTVYDLVGDDDGNLLGPSSVDIAVSPAGTTLGAWSIYQLDTSDTGGTSCPCFGDYPHLGTDANGLYITTNEFPTLTDGYNGSQVYAIAKSSLVAGPQQVTAAHFDTKGQDTSLGGTPLDGFTLAPALSAGTAYAPNTMYFLSSNAVSGDTLITSTKILLWKITGTSALATDPGSLRLTNSPVAVNGYTAPPMSDQKAGSVPLADCLNITACAKSLLGKPNRYKEYEFAVDSSDSRMLQAAYANGKVWGALDTAVDVGNQVKAGVAYYVVNPGTSTIAKQGTLAVAGNNITYPALGVTAAGKAAMAVSLLGRDYYPSAAWVQLSDGTGTPSTVNVLGTGAGPYDSFDGYRAYEYNRPRFGDYGAASVVGNQVWLASEYIAQTCTYDQYVADNTCGGTRTTLSNWSTHVASVTP
jgi:hypothetical protein